MKLIISILLTVIASFQAIASVEFPVIRSNVNVLTLIADGKPLDGGWIVDPAIDVDEFRTIASNVVFASVVDTLAVNLGEWESTDFGIQTSKGDTARVRVVREALNPFESPDPALRQVAASGLLSREQAVLDIDALIYTISEIHPHIFQVCGQEDLMQAVSNVKASLPDSVSVVELYRRVAPVVTMIGDGHTNLFFPFNSLFTKELKRIPLYVKVKNGNIMECAASLDAIIPESARILSINGHSAEEILTSMLPYVSGERVHFKLSRLDMMFTALFQLLYFNEEYLIRYVEEGDKKVKDVVFPALVWEDIVRRCSSRGSKDKKEQVSLNHPYSYRLDHDKSVAIMDFRECVDPNGMKQFADSLFRTLHREGIGNLIIDVRNNGGGTTLVGDVLLRYIATEPFVQTEKFLFKKTPLTAKLLGNPSIKPGLVFGERGPERFIHPLSEEEGHFSGNVYLLTSNKTYSAANSFAWTFKVCGIGSVIGEETGGMNVSFGDYLSYTLPISGLKCSISMKRFWHFRADENNIHGVIPDICVPASDALGEALKLIGKHKKPHKRGNR